MGTMPHALIGYAGSTLRAAEMFHETFPDETDDRAGRLLRPRGDGLPGRSAAASRSWPRRASSACGIDTPGSRFIEGLDPSASYAVLERHVPAVIRGYRSETELRYLVGAGVSAAAIYKLREALERGGLPQGAASSLLPASIRPSAR